MLVCDDLFAFCSVATHAHAVPKSPKVLKSSKIFPKNEQFWYIQGWEFALLLFALSLKIAHFKEQP